MKRVTEEKREILQKLPCGMEDMGDARMKLP